VEARQAIDFRSPVSPGGKARAASAESVRGQSLTDSVPAWSSPNPRLRAYICPAEIRNYLCIGRFDMMNLLARKSRWNRLHLWWLVACTAGILAHKCGVGQLQSRTSGREINRSYIARRLAIHSCLLLCYSLGLRRLLSIAILLVIGLPTISPLLALPANSSDGVPACCRRDGKHHCTMQMARQTVESYDKQHGISVAGEKCPRLPKACPGTRYSQSMLDAASASFADVVLHPALAPQSMARQRISFRHSHQKRGPPVDHI
jgi:hypothetical protein